MGSLLWIVKNIDTGIRTNPICKLEAVVLFIRYAPISATFKQHCSSTNFLSMMFHKYFWTKFCEYLLMIFLLADTLYADCGCALERKASKKRSNFDIIHFTCRIENRFDLAIDLDLRNSYLSFSNLVSHISWATLLKYNLLKTLQIVKQSSKDWYRGCHIAVINDRKTFARVGYCRNETFKSTTTSNLRLVTDLFNFSNLDYTN